MSCFDASLCCNLPLEISVWIWRISHVRLRAELWSPSQSSQVFPDKYKTFNGGTGRVHGALQRESSAQLSLCFNPEVWCKGHFSAYQIGVLTSLFFQYIYMRSICLSHQQLFRSAVSTTNCLVQTLLALLLMLFLADGNYLQHCFLFTRH